MSFGRKWKFAFKCMKYSYNLKINLICAGIFIAIGVLYETMDLVKGMGGYLLIVVSMYPAQILYSVCGSQLVQSSPYKKALMTSMPTMLTLCSGLLSYVLLVVLEGVRMIIKPETADQSISTILMAGILLLILDIYVGIVYKYFWVSMMLMCISIVGIYSNISFILRSRQFTQLLSGCSLPVAIVVGLCLALLGSLLQYGISLLVYKKPVSKQAIYGMMRQKV